MMDTTSRRTPYNDGYETCLETRAALLIYPRYSSPELVTAQLQISPTSTITAGEEKIGSHTGRTWIAPKNLWELSSDKIVQSLDLRRHLDWLLAQILPSAQSLLELQKLPGLHMGVNCAWYSRAGHGGPTLWPEQMQLMAQLNLECSFDLYFLPDEEEPLLPSHRGIASLKRARW